MEKKNKIIIASAVATAGVAVAAYFFWKNRKAIPEKIMSVIKDKGLQRHVTDIFSKAKPEVVL